MIQYTYYGHACFSITCNQTTLLFDPFISGNELAAHIKIEDIDADYILLSHGHADHILDAEAIALRTGATVICSWEIHEWLQKKGVQQTHPMNTGGKKTFDEFSVKCVVAQHSSGLPDGTYGGNPMGFLIYIDGYSFYYSGDTALTLDMQLIPGWANINFAVLPIGDNFTMGVDDAIIAAQFTDAKKVIGVHYNTFGFIQIDTTEAVSLFQQHEIELLLPAIGETITLQ